MAVRRAVRIAAGRLRGRRIPVPGEVRPTASRVREALMDIWLPHLIDARFLDLFAGSGAVGFEALSRGAGSVVFIEADRRVLAQLRQVCLRLAPERTKVLFARLPDELTRLQGSLGAGFDLVFADPPYRFAAFSELLSGLASLMVEGGHLAVEHSTRVELPDRAHSLACVDRRVYGESCLSFYRARREAREDSFDSGGAGEAQ